MIITSHLQACGIPPKKAIREKSKPPSTSLPEPRDEMNFSGPATAAPLKELPSEVVALPELNQPKTTSSLGGVEATMGSNGTIFLEDPSLDFHQPKTHYQEFYCPSELKNLPSDIKEAWSHNIKLSPSEFFRKLLDTPKTALGSGDLSLEAKGGQTQWMDYTVSFKNPENHQELGAMSRQFSFDEPGGPTVYHSYLGVNEGEQGRGVAKELLARSVELYDEIGVSSVSVYAALEVGGYAWAKYGFKPESPRDAEQLYDTVRDRLDSLDVSSSVKRAVRGLLSENKAENIWALSDLDGVKVDTDEGSTTLGKALLLGTSWPGTLDLKDPQARARFDQYVNKGRAESSPKKS